ncbi:aspartate/glutamate racemase family protein [Evansella cellulosilytica]|uniref:Hydantoin racemase n=1 Tax=Evansella cellulosilytica (strain ATCC 21833 / DSM 2522 / FERM P-1141 / JCM 9156 / N-4) TaxID=649639 RepID=E6TTV5_EVAC2|nr:aspartate/glutamate racemase family protein [Evansella cellulosilytica]ADU31986.1 Hydantoin racemase [Evansella cellulosilytica DSM 2522]
MKIKIINPNTTETMTKNIELAGQKFARSDSEVYAVSPSMGPESIESFYDDYLCIPGVLEEVIKGDKEEDVDAFVIACFGDPGLWAAREVTSKPVVGIAEAAIATAKLLSPNFSIVTPLHRSRKITEEVLHMHGAERFCRSIRTTDLTVLDFDKDLKKGLDVLALTSKAAVEQDRAECILLGCAGFVTFVEQLQMDLGVPVLDGVSPAVKLAEALVDMGCKTSKSLTYSFPEKKSIKGFSQILQP